jgi:phosphoribosyl-ATP pyrophosphohydrolase
MNSVTDIQEYIASLYSIEARHVKRGYCINDSQLCHITNHLLEEAVELQAACLEVHGSPEEQAADVTEEAADVLLLFSHLLLRKGLRFEDVLSKAAEKLRTNWTTDPAEVTAVRKGFSRRTRKDG